MKTVKIVQQVISEYPECKCGEGHFEPVGKMVGDRHLYKCTSCNKTTKLKEVYPIITFIDEVEEPVKPIEEVVEETEESTNEEV